jgi:hypothetical protein
MDGDDAVVLHSGCRPRLAHEALPGRAVAGQRGREHLDGDDAMELFIERPEHHPHPSGAEYLQHLVVPQPAARAGLGGSSSAEQDDPVAADPRTVIST